jgi:citrate synthase
LTRARPAALTATAVQSSRFKNPPREARCPRAAIILDFAQVPANITPAMFTCARTAGLAAHIMEQQLTGRLIRPSARYVGPGPRPVRDVTGAAGIIDGDA